MTVRGQSQQKGKLVKVILDASCKILRWRSWKRVWMRKFFSFYLKPDLLSLAMKENLFLYFWSWGWEGVVPVASLPVGPLLPQDGPAWGRVGRSPVLRHRRQWSSGRDQPWELPCLSTDLSTRISSTPVLSLFLARARCEGSRVHSPATIFLMYTIHFEATELTQQISPLSPGAMSILTLYESWVTPGGDNEKKREPKVSKEAEHFTLRVGKR